MTMGDIQRIQGMVFPRLAIRRARCFADLREIGVSQISPHLVCVVSRKTQRAAARQTPKLQGKSAALLHSLFSRCSLASLNRPNLSHNLIDHAAVGGLSPSRAGTRGAVHLCLQPLRPLEGDLCMDATVGTLWGGKYIASVLDGTAPLPTCISSPNLRR